VVPVYRPDLAGDERIALRQCLRVFAARTVVLVAPHGLDLKAHEEMARADGRTFAVERFDARFFTGTASYNRLMLSRRFYRRFRDSEFILIYQLDAFAFRDELDFWTAQNVDYVGGPWFEGFSGSGASSATLPRGGGGGFSLRRVRSFRRVLNTWRVMKGPGSLLREYVAAGTSVRGDTILKVLLKSLGYKNNSRFWVRRSTHINEDLFWTNFAPLIRPDFRVADGRLALRFSFECQPQRQYEMNDRHLPFGCHAWARYDRDFWRPFFKEQGFDI
jgi:hypothetical protein